MRLVKFTDIDGQDIWINPDAVISIEPYPSGATCIVGIPNGSPNAGPDGVNTWFVEGVPEVVAERLEGQR